MDKRISSNKKLQTKKLIPNRCKSCVIEASWQPMKGRPAASAGKDPSSTTVTRPNSSTFGNAVAEVSVMEKKLHVMQTRSKPAPRVVLPASLADDYARVEGILLLPCWHADQSAEYAADITRMRSVVNVFEHYLTVLPTSASQSGVSGEDASSGNGGPSSAPASSSVAALPPLRAQQDEQTGASAFEALIHVGLAANWLAKRCNSAPTKAARGSLLRTMLCELTDYHKVVWRYVRLDYGPEGSPNSLQLPARVRVALIAACLTASRLCEYSAISAVQGLDIPMLTATLSGPDSDLVKRL